MPYALVLGAVAAAAVTFLLLQINQPLIADEPQFVDVAASLASTARPLGFSGSTWNAVLSHPLLYHSLLAIPVGLAGKAAWAGRLPGVVCFFAAGVLLWFVARKVTGERGGPFLAVLLYGLHPLAIQSALLVEIDTALLPLLGVTLVWYLLRRDFELGRGGWVGLGLLLGVSLAAKLTTPPLWIATLGLYYLLAGRARRLVPLLAAAGLGALVFAAYYFPYVLLRDLPIWEPFRHSFARAALPPGAALGPVLLRRGARVLLWAGLPFLLAFFLVCARHARRRLREAAPAVTFASLAALILLLFYLFVGGDGYGFVKYHAPLVPLVALVLGAAVGPALARERKRTLLFLGGVALLFYALVVRDPLYWPYVAREAVEVWGVRAGEVRKALTLTGAFLVLPIVAFVVMTRRGGRTMAFVILAAAAGPALDFWHARADYECRYNYGERGFASAVASLEAVPDNMRYVVPVDVAFAGGYSYPHVAAEEVLADAAEFRARVRDPGTGAVVLRDSYYLHEPYREALQDEKTIALLESTYDINRYGSFTVAGRKRELRPAGLPAPPPGVRDEAEEE